MMQIDPKISLIALYPACVHYFSPLSNIQPHQRYDLPHSLGVLTTYLQQHNVEVNSIDLLVQTKKLYVQFLQLFKQKSRIIDHINGSKPDSEIDNFCEEVVQSIKISSSGLIGM